jgi:hypothetical protein
MCGINMDQIPIRPGGLIVQTLDLFEENICHDFCCNSLYYDPQNLVVYDPTGWGVHDCFRRLLRIPVPRSQWFDWARVRALILFRVSRGLTAGSV